MKIIKTSEALPKSGRCVLAWMEGAKIPMRAMWADQHTLPLGDDADPEWGEYSEEKDEYFCPAGWYQMNQHEEQHWGVSGNVVAWCELPRLDHQCLAQIEEPARPVAEICSASHDDAQFGERAIKPLCDISGFEYGTQLYAGAAPAAVAPLGQYPHLPQSVGDVTDFGEGKVDIDWGHPAPAGGTSLYSAKQMRAYVDADRAARAEQSAAVAGPTISDEDRMTLAGALGLLRGHRYDGSADALQRVLDANAAAPAPSGWRLVPAVPTRGWIAAVADDGYFDVDCAQMIANILSHAPAAPALEAPAAPAGALQREAEKLAVILRSLAPEGYVPEGVDIYAPDFAPSDGDVFVQRAAELLVELAAAPQAPAAPVVDTSEPVLGEWPRVSGVGRDAESPRTLLLYLQKEASDDELRAIHDALLDGGALATHALSELMHIGYRFEGGKLVPPEKLSVRASEFFGVTAVAAKATAAHSDDLAVDRFAAEMKAKLAAARAKGRGGWETCPPEVLSRMLREHTDKGDPRDVANFCMFLWCLGQPIGAAPAAPAVDADPLGLRDVGEALMETIERNTDALKAVGWLGPMDCPSEVVVDLLNLLDEANTTSALGEWVATLEVDSEGGLDYETVPPCTLPAGCYPLYRAAQAAAKGAA